MIRRDFLKFGFGSLTTQLVLNSFPLLSQAYLNKPEDVPHQYLIVVVFDGGWDVVLGLEPWLFKNRPTSSELFVEYSDNDIIQSGAVLFGPALQPMKNHLADVSVINGLIMSKADNGHPAMQNYMLTGDGQGHSASLVAEVADLNGSFGYGVVANSDVYLADRSVDINSCSTILNLTPENIMATSPISDPKTLIQRSQNLKFQNRNKELKIVEILNKMREQGLQLNDSHALVASMAAGLTQTAQLKFLHPLDTHSSHEKNHLNAQTAGWSQLAELIDLLKNNSDDGQSSLFSKTTLLVVSEFARTPALNAAQGKDHNNFLNSCMISGPGIKSNMAVGGSKVVGMKDSKIGLPYHIGKPVNLITGQVSEQKENPVQSQILCPETVMATVADAMKISRNLFGCVSRKEPSLKCLLK